MRWYLWLRVPYADVTAPLAKRGVHVDRSIICDFGATLHPLYMEAAQRKRRPTGRRWTVDGAYVQGGEV